MITAEMLEVIAQARRERAEAIHQENLRFLEPYKSILTKAPRVIERSSETAKLLGQIIPYISDIRTLGEEVVALKEHGRFRGKGRF